MTADLTEISNSAEQAEVGDSAIAVPSSVAEHIASQEEPEVVTAGQHAEEQTPVVPDPPRDETERLDPEPTGPITLVSGHKVDIVPLKLRETMKLLKIVTRGAGGVLEQTMGGLDLEDPVAFAQTFGALILFSIPEAEDEAVEFIQSMVLPAGFAELPNEEKIEQLNLLAVELANPELDDVVTIVERVVRRESEDIRNLGKRVTQAFKMARKVGDLADKK